MINEKKGKKSNKAPQGINTTHLDTQNKKKQPD
jgi:hypothetical protein